MNKQILMNLLEKGTTTSKKTIQEICNGFWELEPLFKEIKTQNGHIIIANDNAFWKYENEKNRKELIWDISMVHRNSIMDTMKFTICNRFANGDKYGMNV